MRILIIYVPLPSSGELNTLAPLERQIKSLQMLGAQVDVLEIKGIPKVKYLQALPSLRTLARAVDLIHVHYGYCGWLARLQFTKPVVVSFMGDDLLGTPNFEGRVSRMSKVVVHMNRWLARAVDAVIVKSPEMARVVFPVEAYVVPNGIDMDTFQPMDSREAKQLLGWSQDKRYILFPGNPNTPRKGFPLARAAFINASNQVTGPLELVSLWHVPPDRVPLYMNSCAAMLMTSHIEGSPNVVKEAMACNMPVVSVPVGDVPELLAGMDGCLICPRDAEALGVALAKVLRNGQRTVGRSVLESKGLDQESVARKIGAIYEEVLAHRASHAIRKI